MKHCVLTSVLLGRNTVCNLVCNPPSAYSFVFGPQQDPVCYSPAAAGDLVC